MDLGYEKRLYILAFDHRASFEKMVGGRVEAIARSKYLIWDGFQYALQAGWAPADAAGILIDAERGRKIIREAKQRGVVFAVPVERSGQAEFDFEYGARFGEKIQECDPTFSKVLVRYNPAGDAEMNERQIGRLSHLSDWLHQHGRKLMFELLVPPTAAQSTRIDRDVDRYHEQIRPQLMLDAIVQLQNGGVEPDIWKIEGIENREECRDIARIVRRQGRNGVSCIVLGRGATDERVEAWLRAAAGLSGYIGFAIGRSIFEDEIRNFSVDPNGYDRETGAARIAAKYRRLISVYERASAAP